MRTWAVVATVALFCTQACGSADFGDKINSPMPTSSSPSAKSAVDSLKERHLPSRAQETAGQKTQNDFFEVSKLPKTTIQHTTPSPQEKFTINLAQNVNGLYATGLEDNPLAAFYEATRNAYLESSLNNFYSHPFSQFQHPVNPFTEFHSRQNHYIDPVGTTFLAPANAYSQPPPPHVYQTQSNNRLPHPFQQNKIQETTYQTHSNNRLPRPFQQNKIQETTYQTHSNNRLPHPFQKNKIQETTYQTHSNNRLPHPLHKNKIQETTYQTHSNNRLPHPFQKNKIQETTYVGINTAAGQNNLDDYDDGSYDPYKYGDYVYFDDDYNSQQSQQSLAQPADIPTPYQQHHGNIINQASHNHQTPNYPQNIVHQTQHKNHQPLTVSHAANSQQPQPFHADPNNHQSVKHIHSNQFHYTHEPQKVQQPQQQNFQSPIVVHDQVHSAVHPQNNAAPNSPKDASKNLDDNYSYQVEATKQYLKEIEEQQEYAKRVLASKSPEASHQSSQPSGNANFYNDQNQESPSIDGRYNNFPLESTHYQQTARPSHPSHPALQPPESSTIKSHANQQTSLEGHYQQMTSPNYPAHQAPEATPTRSYPNQETSQEGHYHQTTPARPLEVNSIRSHVDQQVALDNHSGHFGGSLGTSAAKELHAGDNPSSGSPVPTAVPVLLPSGFLADTEEVRLAKIAHLQMVLDALRTVSTYRRQFPKQRVVNAL